MPAIKEAINRMTDDERLETMDYIWSRMPSDSSYAPLRQLFDLVAGVTISRHQLARGEGRPHDVVAADLAREFAL